jgi:SAM-dependent methyltransferase
MTPDSSELEVIYSRRFATSHDYRRQVWEVLTRDFFNDLLPANATVLDLGCGYGEFINNIRAGVKYGMDLNPATGRLLAPDVSFLRQDCSAVWPLPENSLDVVFTSNFFEHLPDKATLGKTLDQALRCLKPGGKLIAMGPNIKYLPGTYWDFWDHYLPLSETSLGEGLVTRGFSVALSVDRFLPYTMARTRRYPLILLRIYLKLKPAWPLFGKQFLVIGEKPPNTKNHG